MDAKGNDNVMIGVRGSAAGSSATGSQPTKTPWWRWSHGKSGSISSSSDTVNTTTSSSNTHGSSVSASSTNATSHIPTSDINIHSTSQPSASSPMWETMRWEKRTTRTGLLPLEENTAMNMSPSHSPSISPKFLNSSPSTGIATTSRKKLGTIAHVVPRTPVTREVSVLKKRSSTASVSLNDGYAKTMSSSTVSGASSSDKSEIKWTMGSSQRKVSSRKEKKSANGRSIPISSTSRVARPIALTARPIARSSSTIDRYHFGASKPLHSMDDVPMHEFQSIAPSSPTSTLSTTSSSMSMDHHESLVTCARAVLEDCMRQRSLVSNNVRKRNVDGRAKGDVATVGYPAKSSECGGISCGSSSSDDELSRKDTTKIDVEGKLSNEEQYRQLMLRETAELSSSPDLDSFSPLLEEKGLPVEVRYQLPLALGTANQTDKECTICQLRYGIGDHIVTLPCQHFFHACCVDKWLWNHTSCPLCRTEVTLDLDPDQVSIKHKFNACSLSDQETIRRKMRSSSHRAGFRPVVPANVEVDELERHVASIKMEDEEVSDTTQLNYLVCPTPLRPLSTS